MNEPIRSRKLSRRCWGGAVLAGTAASLFPTPLFPKPRAVIAAPPSNWAELDELYTDQVHRGIARGLDYLTAIMRADGAFPGRMGQNVGVVSLAGLAFLATGHLPGRGPHGETVQRCIDYIVESSRDNGFIVREEAISRGQMYGHGFATLFLAETWGMTQRRGLGDKVRDAVRLILDAQHASGGWRYTPQPIEADLSVTICQVMALRAARNAGVFVPGEAIEKAIDYIRRSQNPDGGFMYQMQGGESRFPLTAGSIVALQNAGRYEGEELELAYRFLKRRQDAYLSLRQNNYFMYAHYYSVQAFWQRGGEDFARWYEPLRDVLLVMQRGNGAWYDYIGEAYGTAMGCLILSAPRTYLPIFQR